MPDAVLNSGNTAVGKRNGQNFSPQSAHIPINTV